MSDGGKVVSTDCPGGIKESSGSLRGDHGGTCLSLNSRARSASCISSLIRAFV